MSSFNVYKPNQLVHGKEFINSKLLLKEGIFMYYVNMTDSFFTNGKAFGNRKNKLSFVCDSYEQAEQVARNAATRSEMKYITIAKKQPRTTDSVYVQTKTIDEYPQFYSAHPSWLND